MERLAGSALGSLAADPAILQQIPSLVANLQIGLHKFDPISLRTQLLDNGVDIAGMTPTGMLDRISQIAVASGDKTLIAIHEWLTENWPEQPETGVICHGDFHPNNILYADGKVTGLIDWGNVLFTHAQYDAAVTHLTLSIGPIGMDPAMRIEMQPMIDELLAQYLDIYRSELPLDDDLFAYYGALRSTHAYAKVIGARQGVGLWDS